MQGAIRFQDFRTVAGHLLHSDAWQGLAAGSSVFTALQVWLDMLLATKAQAEQQILYYRAPPWVQDFNRALNFMLGTVHKHSAPA
jgi:hypothetical protein